MNKPLGELIEDGALEVARGVFTDQQAVNITDETARLHTIYGVYGSYDTSTGEGIERSTYDLATLCRFGGQEVLKAVKMWAPLADSIVINKQLPSVEQAFHIDLVRPVVVLYPDGQGRMDHAFGATSPEEAEERYDVDQSVSVMAGDVVTVNNPVLFHRGVNLDARLPRYTIAAFKYSGTKPLT